MVQRTGMIGRMRYTMGNTMQMHAAPSVAIPPPAAPVNTVAPVIVTNGAVSGNSPNGPVAVGDTLTLTSNGTWIGGVDLFSYFWVCSGGALTGANSGISYTVVPGDPSGNIVGAVGANNPQGSASAGSNILVLP